MRPSFALWCAAVFFCVTAVASAQDAVKADPKHYKVEFENAPRWRATMGRHGRGPAEITWLESPVARARQASQPFQLAAIPPRASGSHHCRCAQIRYSST